MDAYIFDLDGTLLDTIEDMTDAVNSSCRALGLPFVYDREGTKKLIGDGVDMLIHRALKEWDNPENFAAFKKVYLPLYMEYQNRRTKPFPGVVETLKELHDRGKKLFVVSNKPDALAQKIVAKTLPSELFLEIHGNRPGEPVKPDPGLVLSLIERFQLKKEATLYVGDSHVDIETARNAGVKIALCLWGYDDYGPSLCKKADITLDKMEKILL